MSVGSEYLGIRVAMLDALKRYHATDHSSETDDQKVDAIMLLVKKSCEENALLGNRGELIGEAWRRFVLTRPQEAVVEFLENPQILELMRNPKFQSTELKSIGMAGALGLVVGNYDVLKTLVIDFESIAQGPRGKETTLIDYKAGESLSEHISGRVKLILQERGQDPSKLEGDSVDTTGLIRRLFDTPGNPVKHGLPSVSGSVPADQNIGHGNVPICDPDTQRCR